MQSLLSTLQGNFGTSDLRSSKTLEKKRKDRDQGVFHILENVINPCSSSLFGLPRQKNQRLAKLDLGSQNLWRFCGRTVYIAVNCKCDGEFSNSAPITQTRLRI